MDEKQMVFNYDDIDIAKTSLEFQKICLGIKDGVLPDGTEFTDEVLIKMLPFKDKTNFISYTSNFLKENNFKEFPVLMSRFYEMGLDNPQILNNYIKKYIENNDMVPDYSGKRGRL